MKKLIQNDEQSYCSKNLCLTHNTSYLKHSIQIYFHTHIQTAPLRNITFKLIFRKDIQVLNKSFILDKDDEYTANLLPEINK